MSTDTTLIAAKHLSGSMTKDMRDLKNESGDNQRTLKDSSEEKQLDMSSSVSGDLTKGGANKKASQAQTMGKTTGRWTKEEHRKFVKGISLSGS